MTCSGAATSALPSPITGFFPKMSTSPLSMAQHMVAAAFFAVALLHFLVWLRQRDFVTHLLFAGTALAAGGNAIAESWMYQATTVESMVVALKWYVATSGFWIIGFVWFVVAYTRVGRFGRWLTVGISVVFLGALVINFLAPCSFLYTEIRGLREITLAWGEQIRLADGQDSPWRIAMELTILGLFVLAINGSRCLWREGQRVRAWVFGFSIVLFFILFGSHAFLVDTGRLNSPYLSSYGFLVVVVVMSYDLAGEVVRASKLSTELGRKEADLLKAVTNERSRIASDLHDSVTQTLFSTAAIADALPDVWDRYPEEARHGLVELRQLTKGALAEMRSLLLELRPTALLEKSLGELLTQLADGTVARTRMPVTANIDCERAVPEDVHMAMYRVAQEALNNVVKHAQATNATLGLTGDTDRIVLVVCDDGKGFHPHVAEEGRLGLEIMRERVRSIGANININSQHGQGTTIEVVWKGMPFGDSDG